MARLHFPAGTVCRQLLHMLTSARHVPTPEQVLNPAFRHDGCDPLQGTADQILSINALHDVDWLRIPPALHLLASHGLSLTSAGYPMQYDEDSGVVWAAARETDPRLYSGATIAEWQALALGEGRRQAALDVHAIRPIVEAIEATPSGTPALVAIEARHGSVSAAATPLVRADTVTGMPSAGADCHVPAEGIRRTLPLFLEGAIAQAANPMEPCTDPAG